MFGYGRFDELREAVSDLGDVLNVSLKETKVGLESIFKGVNDLSANLLHLQREAEARKLELDRVRGAKEHAEASLIEMKRELLQVKEELDEFRTQLEQLSWSRPRPGVTQRAIG